MSCLVVYLLASGCTDFYSYKFVFWVHSRFLNLSSGKLRHVWINKSTITQSFYVQFNSSGTLRLARLPPFIPSTVSCVCVVLTVVRCIAIHLFLSAAWRAVISSNMASLPGCVEGEHYLPVSNFLELWPLEEWIEWFLCVISWWLEL
jgi:hypothetical protein